MWTDFVPIEYEGMSIITLLILFGLTLWLTYIWSQVRCLTTCMNEIKITLGKISVYSEEQSKDISEIKDRLV